MADSSEQGGKEEGEGSKQPVCAFRKPAFRKPASKGGTANGGGGKARKRQRKAEGSDESGGDGSSEEDESVLLRKSKPSQPQPGAGGGKQARTGPAAAPINAYQSNRSTVPVQAAGGATYVSEVDTEHDRDQRALMEMAIQAQRDGTTNDDTKIYRGQAFYKNYVPKQESQLGGNKYTGTQGPIRAPQYLRATCVFDYKPDICKDYKETGYCGFGDSCKFIHDRGDYKSGYELEAEWEAEQKRKRARELGEWAGGDEEEEDEDQYVITEDDDLPFACFICRDGFRDPVVTACGHYFCSACALEHNKQDPKCAACGEKTGGVFNFAAKLYEKHRRDEAKKKARAEREASRAALGLGKGDKGEGEDGEGEEEGDGEGEEGLVIQEEDKANVVKRKKGAWSTV